MGCGQCSELTSCSALVIKMEKGVSTEHTAIYIYIYIYVYSKKCRDISYSHYTQMVRDFFCNTQIRTLQAIKTDMIMDDSFRCTQEIDKCFFRNISHFSETVSFLKMTCTYNTILNLCKLTAVNIKNNLLSVTVLSTLQYSSAWSHMYVDPFFHFC